MYLWYVIYIYQGSVLKKASKRVRKKVSKAVSKWSEVNKRRELMLFNIEVLISENEWKSVEIISASDIADAYQKLANSHRPMIDNKPTYYHVVPVRSR
jgi:hypothetical protein